MDFECHPHDTVNSIASLCTISNGQLVNVKGKVFEMSQRKKVSMSAGTLTKQECYIADPSGCIKVVLWEELVDQMETGKTYSLEGFRIRRYRGDIYLSNPKDEDQCSVKEVPEFAEELQLDDLHAALSKQEKMQATILGIQTITKVMSCSLCKDQ